MLGKGDWKFKREWLEQSRHYSLGDKICPRCYASALDGSAKPWLDVEEAFNTLADIESAKDTRVGQEIWHLAFTWKILILKSDSTYTARANLYLYLFLPIIPNSHTKPIDHSHP